MSAISVLRTIDQYAANPIAAARPRLRLTAPRSLVGDDLRYALRAASSAAAELAARFPKNTSKFEDFRQDLLAVIVQLWPSYEAQRGRTRPFISRIVRQRAISIVRHACARKRGPTAGLFHLNEGSLSARDCRRTGFSEPLPQEVCADVRALIQSLEPELRRFAELLTQCSLCEAARRLGITRHAGLMRLQALRKRFAGAGLNRELP